MSEIIILREAIVGSESQVIESVDGEKNLYLDGIMMQANIRNRNKRVYGLDEISRAVESVQEQISNSCLMGELDHPSSIVINLDRVSHLITQLRMVGENAYGKAKILAKTPCGAVAKALVESGVKIGFSSRGTGAVSSDGNVSEFGLVTVDLVGIPSAAGAVPKPIYESLEEYGRGEKILTLAETVRHDAAAQKYFEKEILKFLSENIFAKKK